MSSSFAGRLGFVTALETVVRDIGALQTPRDADQCVEWFVRGFSIHRKLDRIARQLSINDVLHESASIILRLLKQQVTKFE